MFEISTATRARDGLKNGIRLSCSPDLHVVVNLIYRALQTLGYKVSLAHPKGQEHDGPF